MPPHAEKVFLTCTRKICHVWPQKQRSNTDESDLVNLLNTKYRTEGANKEKKRPAAASLSYG